ncbi:MAG TPA: xanthine dehydrogenase family protein molybdopterin-binding subunit [Xanthobacteraceae bacterium]|jgi:carbon-monoxide dehydrogenase large subunit|nr:xanthine dehydrogenase family protein molybdopterin-binding subunit [Xanthobacteraceae bacterium]
MQNEARFIGVSHPRQAARRHVAGRGRYTDDIVAAHVAHIAFLRSPYAHARCVTINCEAAGVAPGVIAVFRGCDIAGVSRPWTTRLERMPSHHSAPQPALVADETCWQGEAVVAVVAETRAQAEDAIELIEATWEELPAVESIAAALIDGAPPVHTALKSNVALDHTIAEGDVDAAFAQAQTVVSHSFAFGRQTGVSLEPRSILAEFDARSGILTVHQSHQVPFQMREIYAEQLGLSAENVRVIAPDVGGAFGLKLHAYADEMAVVAIARTLGRPVKFVADRLESFISDAHAREVDVDGRIALDADGRITALEIDVIGGFGAYSCYPRSSVGEVLQAVQLAGAPYHIGALRGRIRGVYQNKVPTGAYRGVGQPIACAVTEQLIDLAARAAGLDPAALRARNFRASPASPSKTEGGVVIETLSLQECLSALCRHMDYDALRREQASLRKRGIWRGIGLSAFIEITGVGPGLYGPQGVKVSAYEGCRLSLQRGGKVRCATSVTDQGQGTIDGLAQVIAEELGIVPTDIHMVAGDTGQTPYGGGAWASRGIALGGEAALRASRALRGQILSIAGALLQADAADLSLRGAAVIGKTGAAHMSLAELADIVRFRSDTIPLQEIPPLEAFEQFVPLALPYLATNGIQAALVEVDPGLGTVRVLRFWVADDCGRIINPQLVDEQIRGGVVQGIGAALFEQCIYQNGQLVNGSLADYQLPLASEMPDIDVLHVSTPTRETLLGARGVGEAGVVGSLGAMWTAVNDALTPSGARVTRQPFTPEHILDQIAAAKP